MIMIRMIMRFVLILGGTFTFSTNIWITMTLMIIHKVTTISFPVIFVNTFGCVSKPLTPILFPITFFYACQGRTFRICLLYTATPFLLPGTTVCTTTFLVIPITTLSRKGTTHGLARCPVTLFVHLLALRFFSGLFARFRFIFARFFFTLRCTPLAPCIVLAGTTFDVILTLNL